MPFVIFALKRTIVGFTVAAATVLGTQVGKVVWDKGLKRFTEKTAEDIFQDTEENPK
jgi:hypothetical protein